MPCQERVHKNCFEYISSGVPAEEITCPWCGEIVTGAVDVARKTYAKQTSNERKLIVEAADRSEDWRKLASALGIKRSTAHTWVKLGRTEANQRGGNRPKIITTDHADKLLTWLAQDSKLKLKRMKERCVAELGFDVSLTTLSRALNGLCYPMHKEHQYSGTKNRPQSKEERKKFVELLQERVESGEELLYPYNPV